ncbi:DUF2069 domain-containing protein [Simiduia curdlanivorans]|uniref:DUF2069 domain-containing protein n=1 Tax=Simiduia curdlanivorans TaxID=1492769 RepID=A0ABV8V0T1_9GAMM|nr:DUF2069 domain-containing protein [Simiduia curdlanivorans]MDN3640456.1 DUF2069 domain-containing protein [Simiduia curdlanivorans]
MTNTETTAPAPENGAKPIPNVYNKARWGWALALGATAILLLSALVEYLVEPSARLSLLLLQSIPLLLFVPGMWVKHYRTFSWLCFVVLFYFIVAVTQVMSPMANGYGWVNLIASVVLFNAAMMTSRWLQYIAHQPKKSTI